MKRIVCWIIGHNIKSTPGDFSRCTRCKRLYIDIAMERMGRQIGGMISFARSRGLIDKALEEGSEG